MYSPIWRAKLLLATYAFLICVFHHSCRAEAAHNTTQDCASSCGHIHNIAYPFRLSTDPKHCGIEKYQLSCENNVVMLYLNSSGELSYGYRVQAINYNNFTVRLSNPNVHLDNCGLPVAVYNNSEDYDWSTDSYLLWSRTSKWKDENRFRDLIFLSCEYPMNGSEFEVYNSPCNLTRHWYLMIRDGNGGDGDDVLKMGNSCRMEAIGITSLRPGLAKNLSYVDVNNSFAFEFELSWSKHCYYTSKDSTKYNCSLYGHSSSTKLRKIRASMSTDFEYMFFLLHKIKLTSFFHGILAYLDQRRHIRNLYSGQDDLTICGRVIYYLATILAILVLYRELLYFLGLICVTVFLIYKWRRRHQSAYDNVEKFLQSHHNCLMPVRYTYSEIKKITKGFKEKLGHGGYGSVYKGKLRSGRFAAIKMLDKSKANGQDFINEVATIGRIHHVNVVQLIGFCVENSKRALVYEFMDNGSLDKHIFLKESGLHMNSKMIFDICLGVTHGIEYLHQGCDMQILHFDIKPHNILLDEKFIPKISDFGLAKLHSTDHSIVSLTAVRGTMGYMAPEFFYRNIGGISYKADVYSFGMLLMEMVGRRKNINAFTDHSSRIYFPSWIYNQFNEGKEIKLGDETEEGSNMVKKMIIVALWCIQLNPVNRPSMRKVIQMLEGEVEHINMPPTPFSIPGEMPTNDAGLNTNPEILLTESSDYLNTINLLID